MNTKTPVVCPACGEVDINPDHTIVALPFMVQHDRRVLNMGRAEKLLFPGYRWDCPACGASFLRGVCCFCGRDRLAPQSTKVEGGFALDCLDCLHQRTIAN